MTRPCRETEGWLGQPSATLSEAQRLTLEQHLHECAECRALHGMSRALGATLRAASGELTPAARERAIAGAFTAARRAPSLAPKPWLGRALAGVAVAAAALVFGFYTTLRQPEDAWLEGAGVRTFAHASVTLSDDARVRFDAEHATLALARGALEVEVDPRPHAPFAVQTAQFRALVLGTSFHIDAERVIVRHGHVRVMRGDRQLADLHAGERFEVARALATAQQASPPSAAAEPSPPPEPIASAPAEPPPVPRSRTRSHARGHDARRERTATNASKRDQSAAAQSVRTPSQAGSERIDADAALAGAREALARDALDEVRSLLHVADGAARTAAQRVEAGTLRAELALRERDTRGAIAAYLRVANEHPGLAGGENALFAAAQLSAPEAARPLFERYLERYPQGRFAPQVRSRLQAAAR